MVGRATPLTWIAIARDRPDVVICDYRRAGAYLRNLDGRAEYHVNQVYLTSLPVYATDGLSLSGVRNDVYVDITPVVGRKVAAMDCFAGQGYSALFARKLIEAANGEAGRAAGVNFAEGFYRLSNETHALLPVTAAVMADDPLVRLVRYSGVNLRAEHPMR